MKEKDKLEFEAFAQDHFNGVSDDELVGLRDAVRGNVPSFKEICKDRNVFVALLATLRKREIYEEQLAIRELATIELLRREFGS